MNLGYHFLLEELSRYDCLLDNMKNIKPIEEGQEVGNQNYLGGMSFTLDWNGNAYDYKYQLIEGTNNYSIFIDDEPLLVLSQQDVSNLFAQYENDLKFITPKFNPVEEE